MGGKKKKEKWALFEGNVVWPSEFMVCCSVCGDSDPRFYQCGDMFCSTCIEIEVEFEP